MSLETAAGDDAVKYFLVPVMLFVSSALMTLAWLGHLKFKTQSLWLVILISWLIVLPEYVLNVFAIRYGHGTFPAAVMAAINLSTGVVCVVLVSTFYLGESLRPQQIVGFVLLTIAMGMIGYTPEGREADSSVPSETVEVIPETMAQDGLASSPVSASESAE